MSFDDIFGDFLNAGQRTKAGATPKPVTKPLPQIRGRHQDGVLWVRAEDVADALESQAPKANARLIAKLRGAR